ncbi:MAG: InlB B-repeat-containing protein, partial [Clostridia bacterium]|nr:InlB B-repeat-containing protein [Clostridia bacterium]
MTERTIVDGVVRSATTASVSHGQNKTFAIAGQPTFPTDEYVYYVFCGWYNGATRLSPSTEYTYPTVSSAMTVDAVWSTVTIQNICDASACDSNKFRVNAIKESGDDSLDYAVVGDYVGFVSSGVDASHTFVNWQGNKTSTDRTLKIITSSDAVTLQCHWTEYTLKVVTSVDTDWTITKTIGQSIDEMTADTETPVSAAENVILSVTPASATQLTFAGWYKDDNYSVLATDSVSIDYVFTMSKENKTVYAKWIQKPLVINYLGVDADPTLIDHITVRLDYGENYCGGDFNVSADVDPGYYYGGIFEDASGNNFLTDTTIPSQTTNLYVKVTKTPFTVISNIAGAGKIMYKLSEKNNSSLLVKAQKTCSSFGKTSVFEEGIAYTDILTLTSSTYNGYFWLGWYYASADAPTEWKLLTNKKDLEIKMSGRQITYRATWKKIETSIKIDVTNLSATAAAPGTAEYYSRIDAAGTQILTLLAHINPGFCFEGWYVKRVEYDIDDVD